MPSALGEDDLASRELQRLCRIATGDAAHVILTTADGAPPQGYSAMKISAAGIARELKAKEFPVNPATVAAWARNNPGLAVRLGGRWMFDRHVVDLVANGVPLGEIAARLKQSNTD